MNHHQDDVWVSVREPLRDYKTGVYAFMPAMPFITAFAHIAVSSAAIYKGVRKTTAAAFLGDRL